MNRRQLILFNIMILLVVAALPWFYIVEGQVTEISKKKKQVSQIEEELIGLSSLMIPSESAMKKLIIKYNGVMDRNKIKVSGINRASNLIKSLEKSNFQINRVDWNHDAATIYLKK